MSIYKIGQFAKLVRRTPATIRRWEAEGKITSKRLPSGHRYFDDSDLRAVMGVKAEHRVTVVYCRVSCKGQKPDLDRQLESMQMWAVGSGTVVDEWITEIGGGMNFKRPKFLALIDRICRGEISRLIVAHKDRLVRFGFELIRHMTASSLSSTRSNFLRKKRWLTTCLPLFIHSAADFMACASTKRT